jgi:hypothetical protein
LTLYRWNAAYLSLVFDVATIHPCPGRKETLGGATPVFFQVAVLFGVPLLFGKWVQGRFAQVPTQGKIM